MHPGRVALEGRVVHHGHRSRPGLRVPETVTARGVRTMLGVPLLREGFRARRDCSRAETGAALHRAADRTGAHLCRSGGHRDRERAAARRIAAARNARTRIGERSSTSPPPATCFRFLVARPAMRSRCGADGRDGRAALRRPITQLSFRTRGRGRRSVRSAAPTMDPEYWALRRQQFPCAESRQHRCRAVLDGRVIHVADSSVNRSMASPSPQSGRRSILMPLMREGRCAARLVSCGNGSAFYRQPGRTAAHLCRPGGHRHRERRLSRIAAPHARPRGVARIPDRDQRRAEGHQPLDRRCPAGIGYHGRDGRPALRRRSRDVSETRGRGLPRCGDYVQRSGTRVLGDCAPANRCPRSRNPQRAGVARRQGRANRGHPR